MVTDINSLIHVSEGNRDGCESFDSDNMKEELISNLLKNKKQLGSILFNSDGTKKVGRRPNILKKLLSYRVEGTNGIGARISPQDAYELLPLLGEYPKTSKNNSSS